MARPDPGFLVFLVLAHVAGGYTMSAIAKEAGLSVSRISRIAHVWETAKAKGKT
ncbi:MAG: hypothetical protein ACYCY1_02195 [Sulfuriferula sp.]